MTTARVQHKVFSLAGGYNSDVNPLLYPEGFTVDEDNFDILANQTRRRRRGFSKSGSATVTPSSGFYTLATDSVELYRWHGAGDSVGLDLVVVQAGRALLFYKDIYPWNDNFLGEVSLGLFKISGATNAQLERNKAAFTAEKGRLVVVHKYCEPFLVEYDEGNDSVFSTSIELEIRDVQGVEESIAVDFRPATLTNAHQYNLENQGWTLSKINTYQAAKSKYPSNADIWHWGKTTNSTTFVEAWDADQFELQAFGTTRAPQGHKIKSLFTLSTTVGSGSVETTLVDSVTYNETTDVATIVTASAHGRSVSDTIRVNNFIVTLKDLNNFPKFYTEDISGDYTIASVPNATTITVSVTDLGVVSPPPNYTVTAIEASTIDYDTTLPVVTTMDVRAEETASYAGRIWYTKIGHRTQKGAIYYTQIIEGKENYSRCYQANDPTSEHISDLLDTDGGSFVLSGIGDIQKLVPTGNFLLVLTSKGVWAIGPGEKGYFSPNSYTITKVTDNGTIGPRTIITLPAGVIYWGTSSIVYITGSLEVVEISDNKVKSFFLSLTATQRSAAFGAYDAHTDSVYWLYKTSSSTKVLGLYLLTQAFFNYTLGTNETTSSVIAAASLASPSSPEQGLQLLGLNPSTNALNWVDRTQGQVISFADEIGGTSTEVSGFLQSGYNLLQEPSYDKFGGTLTIFFNKTETGFNDDGSGNLVFENPSGCTARYEWDWSNNAASGKQATEESVYRFTRLYIPADANDTFADGRPVVFTRNQVRGSGYAFSLRLSTQTGKDCWLLGWSMGFNVNASPYKGMV